VTLEGRIFRADDEVKLFVQRGLNEQSQTIFGKGHNEVVRAMAMVYRRERRICRKIGIPFRKSDYFVFRKSPVYI
jgi:hypothetical protein